MIKAETRNRVARIELARPEKRNALTAEMYLQLADALAAADADPQARAILLHGSRDCFTAGNDLADFLKRPPQGEASATWKFFAVLPNLKKPVVAAVAGPAVGIGTTLLLHCDFVYAASTARFQLPFVPLGIVPEFGSTYLLPLLAGYQRAAELLLLGQPFTAEKAREAGIVTEVLAPESLMAKAEETANALAALPPESLRLTKRLLKSGLEATVKNRIAEEGKIFVERLASPEAKEAMSAFLEKRKPDFTRF
ncbi:MAG TPA: enoyl-CoA hydratase-related protein [Burkholderiales bacterium]|nr:enoyl-CoA hydratase-related protein [Burkholderiales bacterium]